MSSLRALILCGGSPRHFYVANRLCKASTPLAIVQETGSQVNAAKIWRLMQPRILLSKASRWARDRKRHMRSREARFFFGDAPPRLDRHDLVVNVPHINHVDVVRLADQHHPDVVAVFGTSLIKSELLGKGRLGIVNLHGGLSPQYRGADCTFWALYNGEPELVGCSLHFIDRGIDTGRLIAHVRPEVTEGDDEQTLFWRAIRESAEIYAELLDRMELGERFGQVQCDRGHLYQVKDRMWHHDLVLAKRMRAGLLRGLHLPRRVTWFPEQRQ